MTLAGSSSQLGPSTDADLSAVRRALSGRPLGQELQVCRAPMAFAQLTYRRAARHRSCLRAQGAKLYHMGIRGAVSRSTLADANEQRDWRIYADFAQRLIHTARRLYVDDALALELRLTVYALDSSTSIAHAVPLGLPQDQGGGQAAHTSRRGSIPRKLHDVNVMPVDARGRRLLRWTGPTWTSPGSTPCTGRTPSSSCAPNPTLSCAVFTRTRSTAPPGSSATRPSCSPASPRPTAIPTSCGASRSATPSEARPWSS